MDKNDGIILFGVAVILAVIFAAFTVGYDLGIEQVDSCSHKPYYVGEERTAIVQVVGNTYVCTEQMRRLECSLIDNLKVIE